MLECKEEGDLTSTMEDYLEAVWSIECRGKVPRVKDVSDIMHVTPPTVHSAMKCLKKRGLIHQENYGYIELTEEGKKIARVIQKRHDLLVRFLKEILGLEEEVAKEDGCRLEHCVSPVTVERIVRFLDFVDTHSASGKPQWLNSFHRTLFD
jgi:DtxR family Mn-dependent transcriptional regulator